MLGISPIEKKHHKSKKCSPNGQRDSHGTFPWGKACKLGTVSHQQPGREVYKVFICVGNATSLPFPFRKKTQKHPANNRFKADKNNIEITEEEMSKKHTHTQKEDAKFAQHITSRNPHSFESQRRKSWDATWVHNDVLRRPTRHPWMEPTPT